MAAAQQVVAEAPGGAPRLHAGEGPETAPGGRTRALEGQPRGQRTEGRVDQRDGDPTASELRAEPGGAVTAGGARLDPLAREGRVVEVAARDEVGDDDRRDLPRRAPPHQARGEVGARPGTAREEVRRGQAGAAVVEAARSTGAPRYDCFREKGRPPANGLGPAGFCGSAGAATAFEASIVSSPVEKMPRTLRSKSSGLVAASRAVS